MAEIPTITAPTLTPQPEMNPRIAGRPGMVMSNSAEQMGATAEQGFQFAEKLRAARNVVDVQKGEIGISLLEKQAQEDLKTAGTDEQKEAIQQRFQEQSQEHIAQYKDPKVGEALRLYSASKSADLQGTVLVTKTNDVIKEAKATNILTGEKNGREFVQAAASGLDTSLIEGKEQLWLASLVHTAVMTEGEAKVEYDKWIRAAKSDTIGALANSPDPAVRKNNIAQLKEGKGLLVEGMDLAERNTTLTAAESRDRELTTLAESQNLNSVLNNMHDAFDKFPYTNNGKGDYEARENAVDNGDFLKSIGAVTPDGKPDRVMGEKLQQEVTRQRAEWEKEEADRANKIYEKYSPDITKMNHAQVESVTAGSVKARAMLMKDWDENARYQKQVALQGKEEADRERKEKSEDEALNVLAGIRSGKIYTAMEIRTMPGIVPRDRTQLIEAATESQKDPTYRAALNLLSETFTPPPLPKNATEMQTTLHAQQAALKNEMQVETWAAFRQEANAHPERNKVEVMQEALKPAIQKQIADHVSQMFGPQQTPANWVRQNFNRLMWRTAPKTEDPLTAKIHVRDKATHQTGTIPANEWDETKYEKVP